ncbi:MAG TPA: hypothetical protein VKA08_07915 [Balneolales bacterium]|jgi:hypothetical protein|nr:hypothetical protein [Balneolales bacterium]
MESKKISENRPLSEIVKEVLEIDDCDLINNVIDKLVSPKKEINKKAAVTHLHRKGPSD